jgi:hypothetical protein
MVSINASALDEIKQYIDSQMSILSQDIRNLQSVIHIHHQQPTIGHSTNTPGALFRFPGISLKSWDRQRRPLPRKPLPQSPSSTPASTVDHFTVESSTASILSTHASAPLRYPALSFETRDRQLRPLPRRPPEQLLHRPPRS